MSTGYSRPHYLVLLASIALLVLAASFSAACSAQTPTAPPPPTLTPELQATAEPRATSAPAIPSTETPVPAQTPEPSATSAPATSVTTPVVLAASAGSHETELFVWTTSDGIVALVDVPEGWEEDTERIAAYAGREDLDVLFLWAPATEGLPTMSIYRVAKLDDDQIDTRVSKFLEPSDKSRDQHTLDGEIGGVAVVVMNSVFISEQHGNEKLVTAYAQLEDDHTWFIGCYAAEFDTGQHADCNSALRSVQGLLIVEKAIWSVG